MEVDFNGIPSQNPFETALDDDSLASSGACQCVSLTYPKLVISLGQILQIGTNFSPILLNSEALLQAHLNPQVWIAIHPAVGWSDRPRDFL